MTTTYQIFQLYDWVEDGVVTRDDARAAFFQSGLIEFRPSHSEFLCNDFEPINKTIIVVVLNDTLVSVGDTIIIEKDSNFERRTILSLRDDDNDVPSMSNGEAGIKLDGPVPKRARLWLRRENPPDVADP